MKHFSFVFLSLCMIFIITAGNAGTIPAVGSVNSNFTLTPRTIHLTSSAKPSIESGYSEKKSSRDKKGIITGVVMIGCGALLSYAGQELGDDYYDKYQKSAFTENTDKLRRKVNGCNVLRIGGAVVAGTGLFVMVFSF